MRDEFAEHRRVEAESAREIAERGRVTAESNAEDGRVEAEARRVTAESMRAHAQVEFENELDKLREDPEHYMTPGARKYFRRVSLGYLILAIGCMLGIKFVADNAEQGVRNDINEAVVIQCKQSIPTINKFNDLIDIQIESNRAARAIAMSEDDNKRVALATRNIIRLQENKLRIPSVRECEAPLLK